MVDRSVVAELRVVGVGIGDERWIEQVEANRVDERGCMRIPRRVNLSG
jgi:hypothetical protein